MVAAGVLVYLPALGFGFLAHDDADYVVAHPQVRAGLSAEGVRWALTGITHNNWHPLTMLSHMLDVELYGLDARGHHATSLALHLLSALAVLALLAGMTGAIGRSAVVASLFALHPVHVESVAWISERKDVLSVLFGLLSLLAWVQARATARALPDGATARVLPGAPALGWYGLALLGFAASLACKGMLVTLPFVMVLLDVWPLGRSAPQPRALARSALGKLPFFALALGSALITWSTQSIARSAEIPLGFRAANALLAYQRYLEQAFWPARLAAFYPYPTEIAVEAVVRAGLLVAALSLGAVLLRVRLPACFTGWFWFAGALLPVIGLVQVGYQAHADRYAYFPSIGLYAGVVFGAYAALQRIRLPGRDAWLALLALAALAALAIRARAQVELWRDDFTLFAHASSVTERNYFAETALGMALVRAGRPAEALAHLERALAWNPDFASAVAVRAHAQRELGSTQEALRGFARALRLDPGLPGARAALGFELERVRAFDEAARSYEAELARNPDDPLALARLAVIRANHGDPRRRDVEEALRLARRACEVTRWLDPGPLDALASAEAAAGLQKDAIEHATRAATLARERGELARAREIERRRDAHRPAAPLADPGRDG